MRFVSLLALVTLSSTSLAHTPPSAESFSRGLSLADDDASAPVVLIRVPPRGHAWIAGGTFAMGSSEVELAYAVTLCEREPFGTLPDLRAEGPHSSPFCEEDDFRIEVPRHAVTLTSFSIDRTEVRVEDYDRCVVTGTCSPPGFRRGDDRFDRPNFPVTSVDWESASTYCRWAHGALPTEAQWEYAARGVSNRIFPWGNVYNAHLANHGSLGEDTTDATDGYVGLAPVGSFPDGATRTGIYDLAGNVDEWVRDAIDVDVNPATGSFIRPYPQTPVTNPVTTSGIGHFARGGSYRSGAHTMRAASRRPLVNITSSDFIGFRCAYPNP